jgi:Putative MetA-pathway of phenol degradation
MQFSRLSCARPLCVVVLAACGWAQDLAPRAYIITPIHTNAVTWAYSFSTGNLILDGSAPITDATAKLNTPVLSLFHTLSFFGRSASFTASLPYGVANFRGTVAGAGAHAYRSGMLDSSFRFSVNLKGGPAMEQRDYVKWRQKTLLGVSIRVVAPTGQYDSAKLINYGSNRWAFKPEIGLSRQWGHWVVDTYGAGWFFTANHDFFSPDPASPKNTRTESPVFAFEGHLSYDVQPRLWASFDGNFWVGGSTSINGVENSSTEQRNSRVGATLSVPVTLHQALKVSYNRGAYIRYGGNYDTVSLAWQYSWQGRPN